IGGFVDAVAHGEVGADDPGSRANVDDIRVGRSDGDRPDGPGRLIVEDRLPGRTVVGRSPDAAVVEADVEHVRLAGHAGQGARAAASCRTDLAPVHGARV